MAYDGWLEFNGTEIVNLSRTAQLAETFGLDNVWITPGSVAFIEDSLDGSGYDSVANAPWYDADYPASAEFAGVIPLGFPGLDDSTTEAATVEYITDGGRSGKQRNATLTIVASVALVASTDRGAEYGKRWLDRVLRGTGGLLFCSGADLRYFRSRAADAPVAHRRDVHLTRAAKVTRKRSTDCAVTWLATFTLTCDDPYEYGETVRSVFFLGGSLVLSDTEILAQGSLVLTQESCPVYDYTPIYDPLHPALVPSPTAPDFFPAGWNIEDGMEFKRYWARVIPVEPHTLNVVPYISLHTTTEARRLRVSVWSSDSAIDDQCDPLFSAVVNYLPVGPNFYVDGEQQASYMDFGFGDQVRRADSLVYAPDARPVQWTTFNDPESLLITLDTFDVGGGVYEGDGDVRVDVFFIPKSD